MIDMDTILFIYILFVVLLGGIAVGIVLIPFLDMLDEWKKNISKEEK